MFMNTSQENNIYGFYFMQERDNYRDFCSFCFDFKCAVNI